MAATKDMASATVTRDSPLKAGPRKSVPTTKVPERVWVAFPFR